jgi:uncharacterized protein YdhG (YjbR/CyaY superfamily)
VTTTRDLPVKNARQTVRDYLAAVPPEKRRALRALRQKISALLPGAEETISYGMPTFKLGGKAIAHYAAFKGHCSFFPASGAIVKKFEDELRKRGFKTSKGTIQFTSDHPIPVSLLQAVIRARMKEAGVER